MTALPPAANAWLERCLELAERGARTAAPNPLVGCVVVRDGAAVGEGWHERPGSAHAERMALDAAGAAARGATAYVSLEPCSHHGRTPPCADALIAAGVASVVVAAGDPAPWVAGAGVERLRAAGVDVQLLDPELELARRARRQNEAFRTWAARGRPHLRYKAAVSIDGRTATAAGDSKWISSAESRALVHEWRARSGAVLVGIGTALADDPSLTARDCEPPAERQPLRVVADRMARLPLDSRLVRTAGEAPTLIVVGPQAPAARRAALEAAGVETLALDTPGDALAELGRREITSVLCEGGATLASALLDAGLIDRIDLFVAPLLIGDPDAPGAFAALGAAPRSIAAALRLASLEARPVGPDTLLTARLREPE